MIPILRLPGEKFFLEFNSPDRGIDHSGICGTCMNAIFMRS